MILHPSLVFLHSLVMVLISRFRPDFEIFTGRSAKIASERLIKVAAVAVSKHIRNLLYRQVRLVQQQFCVSHSGSQQNFRKSPPGLFRQKFGKKNRMISKVCRGGCQCHGIGVGLYILHNPVFHKLLNGQALLFIFRGKTRGEGHDHGVDNLLGVFRLIGILPDDHAQQLPHRRIVGNGKMEKLPGVTVPLGLLEKSKHGGVRRKRLQILPNKCILANQDADNDIFPAGHMAGRIAAVRLADVSAPLRHTNPAAISGTQCFVGFLIGKMNEKKFWR